MNTHVCFMLPPIPYLLCMLCHFKQLKFKYFTVLQKKKYSCSLFIFAVAATSPASRTLNTERDGSINSDWLKKYLQYNLPHNDNTQPYDLQTQFCHVYIQLLSCRLTYVPEMVLYDILSPCICSLVTEVHILLSKHREFFWYLPSLTIHSFGT